MRFLILITILSCLSNSLFSQTAKIEGFVRDDKGNLIVGASVIYRKDITFGASTNEKGFYFGIDVEGICDHEEKEGQNPCMGPGFTFLIFLKDCN